MIDVCVQGVERRGRGEGLRDGSRYKTTTIFVHETGDIFSLRSVRNTYVQQ